MFLPILLKGIGGAIGLGAQFGAASQREDTADLNFQITQQNAGIERQQTLDALKIDQLRSRVEFQNQRANYRLAISDAKARKRNAERIRQFAEARTGESREAIRRRMREFDQFKGQQESKIAASGVAFSGSSLDVLAESAGQMVLALQDMHDDAGNEYGQTQSQAILEEQGARRDRRAATLSFRSDKQGLRLNKISNRFGRLAADSRYEAQMLGASFNQASGYNSAGAQRITGGAGIFTGAAGFLQDMRTRNYKGMR